jgi:hypothetical protein
MKTKIVSGILVILLLTSFVVTTLNVTGVFAFTDSFTKTQNTANDLLKGVDFKKPQSTADTTPKGAMNFWNFNNTVQGNNSTSYWGSSSNEFIIGVSEAWQSYGKVEQLALERNVKIINKVLMGNKIEAVVVSIPQNSVASFMRDIKDIGLGTYVEPRGTYQAFMIPNDPYWNQQWGPAKIKADYAWNITTGSKSVLVADIDTGVDYNHPDIAANYVPLGHDWVNNDPDPMDDNGHGTHVAGIIGAEINNGKGIAGLAQVRIMAEKGLDYSGLGSYDVLAQAIIDATDQNATIINMSWGGSSPSTVIEDALKYAYDHGVLLVAAAGNSASSVKLYPAAYDDVIAVTATDPNDAPAYFTSYGDWVELAAPGVDIYSTISSVHDSRFNYPYDSLSGTSMACPHVVGVAALVWSKFPNVSRDALRLHLRDTADDLGSTGFDIYYGYGRINALKALEQPLPPHDIFITGLQKPPFVEPGNTGTINATIVNYGSHNEANVSVEILVNSTVEQSTLISNFPSGTSIKVSLSWAPTIVGNYNVTVYALPVANETNTKNNMVQGFVYVGIPLRVFVLRSAGTQLTTDTWDTLNYNWQRYGNRLIYIDYTTLNKDSISYANLNATKADVLILSCAYAWEYTDAEIAAITQYVREGHGFIATAGTFYYYVPNNNKFAPLFGMNESIIWGETGTDLLNLLEPSHPLFAGVPNPYTMPSVGTAIPGDGVWSSNELAGGTYVAMGYNSESAIVTYRGLVYISPWLEAIPERYNFNLQLLYNAITWSRYIKPQHELTTTLQVPRYMFPNSTVTINATVTNNGAQNESTADIQLSIYDFTRNTTVIIKHDYGFSLLTGASHTISYQWNPILKGVYDVTAYAQPVPGEENVDNNKVTVLVTVTQPLIRPQEGKWTHYLFYSVDNSTGALIPFGELQLNYYKYISVYEMNVTLWEAINGQGNMTGSTVVNIFNRYDESGVWQNLWFPGIIETNITIGSQVNLLYGSATVIGSEALVLGSKVVDCWKLYELYGGGVSDTFWYDKTNGLWIKLEEVMSSPSGFQKFIIILDNTNIPVGFTPEHELRVTLDAPALIRFGNSSMLNATVSNFGRQNETNIELKLQINGTTVSSVSIPKLNVNASQTINYAWTPSSPAVYNVTAYAPPVAGESITSDNLATVMVKVAAAKGHVLFDQTHLTDFIGMYSIWIANLRAEGFMVDTLLTGNINSGILAGYDVFVTIQAYSAYTNSEITAIQQFVANGGGLLVVGDDYPNIYTSLTGFANISWTYGGVGGATNHIYPHEVTQGVHQVYLMAPAAMLLISGNGSNASNTNNAQALVRDLGFNIMLAANWYQQGRVLGFADEDSLRDYSINLNGTDNLRLATNMIAWLCEKDTTLPEITSITPANGTIIGTTAVKLRWNATDLQSGIDHYSVYRSSQFVANTTAQSYNLSGLIEGANNVTIVTYDRAGNHASKSVIITVNITLQICTPSNNSYVRQAVAINVSGSVANYTHLDLFIDRQLEHSFNTSGEHTYLWNTSADYYVVRHIMLVGYDSDGNNASISITVTVDNMAPTAIILSPTNATYVHGNITITFIAQDTALKKASITIGSTYTYDVTGMNSTLFNTTLLADEIYMVKLVVYDLAGNKAETAVTIAIDNKVPDAQITSPSNSTFVRGSVGINVSYDDTNFGEAVLSIDGQAVTMIIVNRAFGQTPVSVHVVNPFYTWNTTMVTDGMHVITLTVSDYAGNTRTVEIRVFVDNTAPIGEIRSPLNSTYVRGNVDITLYGYDANLTDISLRVDGGSALQTWNTSGTHDRLWDTTTATDGLHTITLTIYDKAGNQLTTSVKVNVDNTPPTVSIVSPQPNATASGTVTISYTANDASTFSLVLFIDNAQTIIYPQQTYQWDTTKVVDGNHIIRIVATDLVGNTKEQTITVNTANTTPTYMTYIGYASAAILGLALGALAVWTLVKRKPSSPTTPPT